MSKFRLCLLIAAIIMVIPLNLNIKVASAASYTYSGTLSNGYPPNINDDPDVTYFIPVVAGDTLNINLSYSGFGGCGRATVIFSLHAGPLGDPQSFPYIASNFSGTFTSSYQMPATMDVSVDLLVGCSHSPLFYRISVDYVLEVTVGVPSTPVPPTPPDPIIAAEEAAGLQRVQDNSLPVVIYTPTTANPDRFIDIRDLVGNPLLYISADDLAAMPEFPTENILIAAEGLVSVYKLTTGEYQVNVGPLPDGKVHVIIFDGIPRTHTYGYTWSPPSE